MLASTHVRARADTFWGGHMFVKHSQLSLAQGRRSLQRIGFALLLSAALPGLALAKTTTEASKLPEGVTQSDWQAIQGAWQAGRHAVAESADQPGTWQARNPGQQWLTRFDGRGFVAQPDHGQWQWGLALSNWGFAGEPQAIAQDTTARVQIDGNRTVYHWGDGLEEWFINDHRGLEHGYTVNQPPAGSGDTLRFELTVRGGLAPKIDDGARDVRFVDAAGGIALTYSGLKVWDADGKLLDAAFAPAGDLLALSVDARGARYPITIDPLAQQAYLKASNTDAGDRFGDQFGQSVAVSGDTVVVGARQEDSNATGVNGDQTNNAAIFAGAAYVFVRNAGVWSQQAYLKASNTNADDFFGGSVAVSGDTVVVGAFREDSSATGVNGNQANNGALSAGAAYVFVRTAGLWSQQAYLKASNTDAFDEFGESVAVSGDTVVVGAKLEDSNATGVNGDQTNNAADNAGAAYVFVRNAGVWSQQAYLKASNTNTDDQFGSSVAVSGDTVVVETYVFVRNAGTWSQQAYLNASNTDAGDRFGESVAVSGDTVVVGAPGEDSNATGVNGNQTNNAAVDSGAAYVFVRNAGNWSQQAYLKASNTDANDVFGSSVAVSGDTVVVGAVREASNAAGVNGNQTNNAANLSGAAYVFVRTAAVWSQQAYLKASNTDAGDLFSASVAVSGNTLVVGAPNEDSFEVGVNGNQTDNSSRNAGAAYVFRVPSFTVGGTVSGLAGTGLVLRNNGGDDLPISTNGAFTFATPVASGGAYTVTVFAQPGTPTQTCTVGNGSGTVGAVNLSSVAVACFTNTVFIDGFEAQTLITALIGEANVSAAIDSLRLPSKLLREVLDGNATELYALRDINGAAAKLYARMFDGQVQYALAGSAENGDLRLGSWHSFDGEPLLRWTANYISRGWVLGSVVLE